MFSKVTYKIFSLCIVMVFFSSCAEDTGYIEISSELEDQKLKDKLIALGGNLDYFVLPESDDFANIPADPNNPLTEAKVLLGKLLFHETGIGVNSKKEAHQKTYSCASCHHSAAGFQSGIKQGIGDGGMGFGLHGEARIMAPDFTADIVDVQPIKSPTVLNSAYQKLMLWNGQFGATDLNVGTEANWTVGTPKAVNHLGFEGVETQAIAGLTVHRMDINQTFCSTNNYEALFNDAFPEVDLAERYTLITAGLAIAAYERTLLANDTNFQNWLKGDTNAMTSNEKKGAALFFGKAQCFQCHSGPALNSEAFYALGMNDLSGDGVHGTVDEANKKGRGGFTNNPSDNYSFKVPQLYNLADVEFFGHGASFTTIKEVIAYKNNALKENANVPISSLATEFSPLGLSEHEIDLLAEFIEKSLVDRNLQRYNPTSLPTGLCFPNADALSRQDMGCN